jgi:hypothetical protein
MIKCDIAKVEHLTIEETTQKLHEAGIYSVEELWVLIGDDLNKGVENVTARTGIHPTQLVNVLIAEATREIKRRRGSGFEWYWVSLKRHLLDVCLLIGLIILIILALRAGRVLTNLRTPLGSSILMVEFSQDNQTGISISGDSTFRM